MTYSIELLELGMYSRMYERKKGRREKEEDDDDEKNEISERYLWRKRVEECRQ